MRKGNYTRILKYQNKDVKENKNIYIKVENKEQITEKMKKSRDKRPKEDEQKVRREIRRKRR